MYYYVPGPVDVRWGVGGIATSPLPGSLTLGYTKSGILLRPSTNWIPILDDEHGRAPADFILGGKGLVIEAALVDPSKLKVLQPTIGNFFSMSGADGYNRVGEVAWDGQIDGFADWCCVLEMHDRLGRVWRAEGGAVPLDPSQIGLMVTQEITFPIAFMILPDSTNLNQLLTLPSLP